MREPTNPPRYFFWVSAVPRVTARDGDNKEEGDADGDATGYDGYAHGRGSMVTSVPCKSFGARFCLNTNSTLAGSSLVM